MFLQFSNINIRKRNLKNAIYDAVFLNSSPKEINALIKFVTILQEHEIPNYSIFKALYGNPVWNRGGGSRSIKNSLIN